MSYLHQAEKPHTCHPPQNGWSRPDGYEGSVWLCDCGQHYGVTNYRNEGRRWREISARRARRLLKRAGVEQ